MAGLPWFELDTDAPEHPKTLQLELLLGSDAAFTYVARLWAYCYRVHLSDRFEGAQADAMVERVVRWPGEKGAFVAAALECRVRPDGAGYLERDGEALVVRGVRERLGPHLAKREADRIRLAEKRAAAEESLRARGEVAQESRRRRRDVAGNKNRDKDRDSPITEVPVKHPSRDPGGGTGEGDQVWAETLRYLEGRVRADIYRKCYAHLSGHRVGDRLVIECRDRFERERLQDNHATAFVDALEALNHPLQLQFTVAARRAAGGA